MSHARLQEDENNEDSFLDVVANVVGVLIILVMLVGAQASRGVLLSEVEQQPEEVDLAIHEPTPDAEQLNDELQRVSQAVYESEKTLREVVVRTATISNESIAFDKRRLKLSQHRSLVEEDIAARRKKLDKQKQQEFDVQRKLVEAKIDLQKQGEEQLKLISSPETVVEVESVPTPLARTVEGGSIHLRIDNGLVSIVPFEELKAEFESNIEGFRRRLQSSGRAFETFGPIDGYRFKVTVVRQRAPNAIGGPRAGVVQRDSIGLHAEVLPVSRELGENVEQSLLPTGVLLRHLQANRRQRPAVVVWLSTDSFDDFRPLKRTLWEMDFPVAVRPLQPGANIEASPQGTKAAAQ